MEAAEINKLVQSQRHFFLTGTTLNVNVRIDALKKLYSAIKKHENAIYDALCKDLCKSPCIVTESQDLLIRTRLFSEVHQMPILCGLSRQ